MTYAPPPAEYVAANKPAKLKTVGILTLIDGILNIIWGSLALLSVFAFNFYGCIQGPLCITLGIFEVIIGPKLMAEPVQVKKPPTALAICQIVNIINVNLLGLILFPVVVGIMSLVSFSDPEVKRYFEAHKNQHLLDG